ncbi:MAG: substrate-binding domain-containing protein [Candidatus Verstraetearchaeota archaeon]|nr:substrate-binding domain-containing protein [Candidatus Verstraetearchaeota archaeon]
MAQKKYMLKGLLVLAVIATGLALPLMNTPSNVGNRLIVATTTSTADTGLLDYLKPYFDEKYSADLVWLSLGTGQAIAVAARGDCDLLLVHDREREDEFISSGNGVLRVTVMYNDFVIVGPPDDPANASGTDAIRTMRKIAESGASGGCVFVSRGDGSGTEALEKKLWESSSVCGFLLSGWYLSAGSGMAATLRVANELGAYTISDRGTFYKLKDSINESLSLVVICENDSRLLNPYGVVLINSSLYPNINSDLAQKFLLFVTSPEGQDLIGNYTVGGRQLFFPIYGQTEKIGLPREYETIAYIENLRKGG